MELDAIEQGGIIFLETTALAMFTRCFASYLHCATHLFSLTQSSAEHKEKSLRDVSGTQPNDNSVKEHAQKTLYASLQAKKQLIEAFLIDVSQFSLVLVVEDESSICSSTLVISYNYGKYIST